MEVRWKRAGGACFAALTVLALAPAAHAAGLGVTSISSLPAGASSGNLTGVVSNDADHAAVAKVNVRAMRRGTGGALLGQATVTRRRARHQDLPGRRARAEPEEGHLLRRRLRAEGRSRQGRARAAPPALADLRVKGGDPLQGKLATKAFDNQNGAAKAHSAQAPACSPGARTLSEPGNRVWPELGNGGYKSLHTDVFTVYDAPTNKFLAGTHVDLTQQATQCLSEFSLDFDRRNNISSTATTPGPDMTISSITIDGVPATFRHVQPTYAGDPKGWDDPDPLAHAPPTPTRCRRRTRTRRRARRRPGTRHRRAWRAARPSS